MNIQPFLDLWQPTVIWRGVIYSVLMTLAKLAVGLPILLYPAALSFFYVAHKNLRRLVSQLGTRISRILHATLHRLRVHTRLYSTPTIPPASVPDHARTDSEKVDIRAGSNQFEHPPIHVSQKSTLGHVTASTPASVFMGVAMVSRGEIGLLIAQLARGSGSSGENGLLGDEAFSVCIWAILLCTLVGPIGTGIVVRRWGPKVASGLWV